MRRRTVAKRVTKKQVAQRVQDELQLRFGRMRAIPGWKLGEVVGLGTGERAVSRIRVAVRLLRREGKLIVASVTPDDSGAQSGYFYAKTADEYRRYMGPFRHRALDILETLKPMDAAAEKQWGARSRLDQVGVGQLEMGLEDPDMDLANVGGPLWYEVGEIAFNHPRT